LWSIVFINAHRCLNGVRIIMNLCPWRCSLKPTFTVSSVMFTKYETIFDFFNISSWNFPPAYNLENFSKIKQSVKKVWTKGTKSEELRNHQATAPDNIVNNKKFFYLTMNVLHNWSLEWTKLSCKKYKFKFLIWGWYRR